MGSCDDVLTLLLPAVLMDTAQSGKRISAFRPSPLLSCLLSESVLATLASHPPSAGRPRPPSSAAESVSTFLTFLVDDTCASAGAWRPSVRARDSPSAGCDASGCASLGSSLRRVLPPSDGVDSTCVDS